MNSRVLFLMGSLTLGNTVVMWAFLLALGAKLVSELKSILFCTALRDLQRPVSGTGR